MEASRRPELSCERTRACISLEVDDELSEFEREFLEAHLRQCGDCRLHRSEIHALAKHIRATPQEAPSRRVRVPVRVSSRRTARLARLQLGAAAALAVAAVGTASMVSLGVDRKPATPDLEETLPSVPSTRKVLSREFHRYGPTPVTSMPTGGLIWVL